MSEFVDVKTYEILEGEKRIRDYPTDRIDPTRNREGLRRLLGVHIKSPTNHFFFNDRIKEGEGKDSPKPSGNSKLKRGEGIRS